MSTDSTHRVWVLVKHNALIRWRDPGQIISYLVLPMAIMVMFKPLYQQALNRFAGDDQGALQVVTGPLIMFSIFAMAVVGHSVFLERQWRTWDRLRTSAASTGELLIGKTVPVFVILLAQQLILLTFGCLITGLSFPSSFALVLLVLVIWATVLIAIGTALATLIRSMAELGMLTDIGSMVVAALGGALVPVSMMPGWLQLLAHFSPGYWGLAMLRAAFRGDAGAVLAPAAILLAAGLVAGLFTVRRLARGWGRSALV
jgi:ABC-2 type transport system permease protein